jgi:hypothetical protein
MRCAAADRVTVHVFGLFHPRTLVVKASPMYPLRMIVAGRKVTVGSSLCNTAILTLSNRQIKLQCGEVGISSVETQHAASVHVAGPIDFSSEVGDVPFILSIPGKMRREYRGTLSISVENAELVPVVGMGVETAVASIVAAELPSEMPIEALKAQAVVTRSFLVASRRHHHEAEFCDTTHCQFLRSPPPPTNPAARAAAQTKGLVLTWEAKPFAAMYSASCGGTTRTLAQEGDRSEAYPYFAVECSYCRRHTKVSHPGHGIGLCQRGAAGMALDGADFRGILAHYFPNTEVRSIGGLAAAE